MIVAVAVAVLVVLVLVVLVFVPRRKKEGMEGGWNKANATVYTSYPKCCTDKKADQTECRDYSGCKYQGQFAAYSGKKSASWVAANNIVAFYQGPNAKNRKEWASKWKLKTMELRNPKTGKVMAVTVVDTCDDGDCGGCCSKNAKAGGGYLVDLEENTAKRFYGGGKIPGMQQIEWRLTTGSAPAAARPATPVMPPTGDFAPDNNTFAPEGAWGMPDNGETDPPGGETQWSTPDNEIDRSSQWAAYGGETQPETESPWGTPDTPGDSSELDESRWAAYGGDQGGPGYAVDGGWGQT